MTGADIIGTLIRADADLTAIVPNDRTKAGVLPDNVALPALLVRLVSSTERQSLIRGQVVRTIDRVSVTVRAGSYRDQNRIIRLVRTICAGLTGNVAGATNASILTAGAGPDVIGPANSFEQTQDFRVSYDA